MESNHVLGVIKPQVTSDYMQYNKKKGSLSRNCLCSHKLLLEI